MCDITEHTPVIAFCLSHQLFPSLSPEALMLRDHNKVSKSEDQGEKEMLFVPE